MINTVTMKNKLFIWSYNNGSAGAKSLRDALSAPLMKHHGSLLKTSGKMCLNWGSTNCPFWGDVPVINHPIGVELASNKLLAFERFASGKTPCPKWTTDKHEAQLWVDNGLMVVVRHTLTGSCGEGIELVSEGELPDAPLYVEYFKKKDEYRVHVFDGKVIDFQRKAKKKDFEGEVNWQIRNHQNGFVFVRGGATLPEGCEEAAISAVDDLLLDFGAVDLCVSHGGQIIVLEVNTAPGLEGQTVTSYTNAIKKYVEEAFEMQAYGQKENTDV